MEGESSAVASPFPGPNSSKGHELEMTKKSTTVVPEMTSSTSMPNLAAAKDGNAKVLPFEFRALEVCLESACRSLEEEVCACIWIFLSGYLSSIEFIFLTSCTLCFSMLLSIVFAVQELYIFSVFIEYWVISSDMFIFVVLGHRILDTLQTLLIDSVMRLVETDLFKITYDHYLLHVSCIVHLRLRLMDYF